MIDVMVRGLSKSFESNGHLNHALRDIQLDVQANSFSSIVGPSGCGKSTLFKVISGLETPTVGEVRLAGASVDGPSELVAHMFQNDLLVDWRDVLGNATLGGEIVGRDRKELREEAQAWLDRMDLGAFGRARPHELSGGMRQRVALVRTLLTQRPLLLLDEPFGALDSMTRHTLHELLLDVWTGLDRTMLLVTHDIEEAILLSDRVYVLSGRPGRVIRTVDVTLGRPRSGDVAMSQEFFILRNDVLTALKASHPEAYER